MFRKRAVCLFTLFLIGICVADVIDKSDRGDFKRSLSKECDDSYSLTCLKLDVVSWLDKLNEAENYDLLSGISVVRDKGSVSENNGEIVAEVAREFPDDPNGRLDAFLLKKVTNFLTSHSLRLNLWDKDVEEVVAEGRGKGGGGGGGGGGGKKGGGMGIILAVGAMMKAALFAVAIKVLALLAGKALFTAKIALLLAGVIGLKSLLHHHHGHHGHHEIAHEDHGWGHAYRRSMELPAGLKPGYKPE